MAVTPVGLRSNFSHLFSSSALPVLEEKFRAALEQEMPVHEQIFKTVPTERDIWQFSEQGDLQQFEEVPEGSEYSFVRRKQGASKTITVKKYGLGRNAA